MTKKHDDSSDLYGDASEDDENAHVNYSPSPAKPKMYSPHQEKLVDSNARSRNSLGFSDSFDSARADDRKYNQHKSNAIKKHSQEEARREKVQDFKISDVFYEMDPQDHYRNTPNLAKNTGLAHQTKLTKRNENDLFSRRDTGLQDDIQQL